MTIAGNLTKSLISVCRDWNAYDLVPDGDKAQCRMIGVQLNEIGGMDAMTQAYYAARRANATASVIQAYWDGIGDWRW